MEHVIVDKNLTSNPTDHTRSTSDYKFYEIRKFNGFDYMTGKSLEKHAVHIYFFFLERKNEQERDARYVSPFRKERHISIDM